MRQIPIEQFKRNIKAEICDLPFLVTRRGKALFVVNHAFEGEKINETEPNRAFEGEKKEKPLHLKPVTPCNNNDYFNPYQKATQVGKK